MHKIKAPILLFIFLFSATLFAQIPDGYYDAALNLTGNDLKTVLHNIIKNHKDYPYTSSTTDTWDILKEADRDPQNTENVILIYTGNSVNAAQEYNDNKGWSREHVWAKSHGFPEQEQAAYRDAHHLKPVFQPANEDRGTKDFDNGGTAVANAPECSSTSTTWEPRDAVKGDVARIMLYMAVRYEGENGEPDLELVDYTSTSTSTPLFGKLSTLLRWNLEDPVDAFEQNRNNVIYSYQNNRNPFIDHPEYAAAIYGTTGVSSYKTNAVSIYPNPAKDFVHILSNEVFENIKIYNIIGTIVKDASIRNGSFFIGDLTKGQYILRLSNTTSNYAFPLVILN